MKIITSSIPAINAQLITAAQQVIDAGYLVVPLWLKPAGDSQKLLPPKGWLKDAAKITKANVADSFTKKCSGGIDVPADGIGVVLRGLVDVDRDDDDVRAIWSQCAPETQCIWGSPARPDGHSLYVCQIPRRDFVLDGSKILEIRTGDGVFATLPPSVYPKASGTYSYSNGKYFGPSAISPTSLLRAAQLTATTAALKKLWPPKGSHLRHDFALCAAGGLARLGLADDEVLQIIKLAAKNAGDDEIEARVTDAKTTLKRYHEGQTVTGWPQAEKIIDNKAVYDIAKFWTNTNGSKGGALAICAASDVTPSTVEWLWPGWLAKGQLTVLAGPAGVGKSLITTEIAARLSS